MNNPFDQFDDAPRGIRNNNPLNVTGSGWNGQVGADGRFAQFDSPEAGRAAADTNLLAYHRKHGINTVEGVVSRWAPPSENDTPAYVQKVSSAIGVDPHAPLDMEDPATRAKLLDAMQTQETGKAPDANPFDQFDRAPEAAPAPAAAPAQAPTAGPAVLNAETGKPYNPAQDATYRQLIQSGQIDPNATPGSKAFPRGLSDPKDAPKPGEWFVGLDGKLQQAPAETLMGDIAQPAADAWSSLGRDLGRYGAAVSDHSGAHSWRDFVPGMAPQDRALGSVLGDAGALAASPITGLLNGFVTQPGAKALDHLPTYDPSHITVGLDGVGVTAPRRLNPGETHAQHVSDINTAMSAARAVDAPVAAAKPQSMTLEELKSAKTDAYQNIDKLGVAFKKPSVRALAKDISATVDAEGGAEIYPKSAAMARRIDSLAAKGDMPFSTLDKLRGQIGETVMNGSDAEGRIGGLMREKIDRFIDAADPATVSQDAKPLAHENGTTFYHGSPATDLTDLKPRPGSSPWGFDRVVSVATDPKFAEGYAGKDGAVYPVRVYTDKLGDFRQPTHADKVVDHYRTLHGDQLTPYDVEAIKHGAWRFWENRDLWDKNGWDGAWVREEPGRSDAHHLNLSLRSGDAIRSAFEPAPTANGNMAAEAAAAIRKARDLNTRYRKVQDVTARIDSADLRAGSSGNGGNLGNATRQKLRPLIDPKSNQRLRNATPDERAALRRVVKGSAGQNTLRMLSAFDPTAGKLSALLQAGAAAGTHGMSLLAAPVGMAARAGEQALAKKNLQDLIDLMSTGGVKYVAPGPTAAAPGSVKLLSPRGLIGGTLAAQPLLAKPSEPASQGSGAAEPRKQHKRPSRSAR